VYSRGLTLKFYGEDRSDVELGIDRFSAEVKRLVYSHILYPWAAIVTDAGSSTRFEASRISREIRLPAPS